MNSLLLCFSVAWRREFYAGLQNLYPVPHAATAKMSGKGVHSRKVCPEYRNRTKSWSCQGMLSEVLRDRASGIFEGLRKPCPTHNIPQLSSSLQRTFPPSLVGPPLPCRRQAMRRRKDALQPPWTSLVPRLDWDGSISPRAVSQHMLTCRRVARDGMLSWRSWRSAGTEFFHFSTQLSNALLCSLSTGFSPHFLSHCVLQQPSLAHFCRGKWELRFSPPHPTQTSDLDTFISEKLCNLLLVSKYFRKKNVDMVSIQLHFTN